MSWSILDFGRSAATESDLCPFAKTCTDNGTVFSTSLEGVGASAVGQPFLLTPKTSNFVMRFGEGGFGEGGFGGTWTTDG